MRSYVLFFLSAFLLLGILCDQGVHSERDAPDENSGVLAFSLAKSTIPSEVKLVSYRHRIFGIYWERNGIVAPRVFADQGKFRMFYTGYALDNSTAIGYAESRDGIQWDFGSLHLPFNPTDGKSATRKPLSRDCLKSSVSWAAWIINQLFTHSLHAALNEQAAFSYSYISA